MALKNTIPHYGNKEKFNPFVLASVFWCQIVAIAPTWPVTLSRRNFVLLCVCEELCKFCWINWRNREHPPPKTAPLLLLLVNWALCFIVVVCNKSGLFTPPAPLGPPDAHCPKHQLKISAQYSFWVVTPVGGTASLKRALWVTPKWGANIKQHFFPN